MSSRRPVDTPEDALNETFVIEAVKRGIIEVKGSRVTYNLGVKKSYDWSDPEEWVRARTVAFLIIERDYPANRIRTEVQVPRRTPSDSADIVVYRDDRRRQPYLVVENKAAGQTAADRRQAIEQAFGNANSLRAEYALYDEFTESHFYDVANYPSMERTDNHRGDSESIPPAVWRGSRVPPHRGSNWRHRTSTTKLYRSPNPACALDYLVWRKAGSTDRLRRVEQAPIRKGHRRAHHSDRSAEAISGRFERNHGFRCEPHPPTVFRRVQRRPINFS